VPRYCLFIKCIAPKSSSGCFNKGRRNHSCLKGRQKYRSYYTHAIDKSTGITSNRATGKTPNIEIKILDLAAESSNFDLTAYFREIKPDSSRFFNRALDISRVAQKVIPGALRIVGGHHVTVLPRESLKGSGFHVGVIGYGEETLTEIVILKALAKAQNSKIDFSTIEGIAYRAKDGKIIVNNPRNNKIPLVKAPPANTMIDLLNLDGYAKDVSFYLEKGKLRGPLASVFTMQGCSFNCKFCANPEIWIKPKSFAVYLSRNLGTRK
jgi:radical SAM superfamily enzyme YgiQ (UPF0313 family)